VIAKIEIEIIDINKTSLYPKKKDSDKTNKVFIAGMKSSKKVNEKRFLNLPDLLCLENLEICDLNVCI
tara:strand:- start:27 stop:230 length:204 start_codon:yes stop_codon:yes gene_type:complete